MSRKKTSPPYLEEGFFRRVAQPLTSLASPMKWVPRSFAHFAKGRVPRTPALTVLRRPIPKRNLRPPFIHFHRGRVAQAGGPAFDLACITNEVGAPFLRALCEGAGTTDACADGSTPPDLETKSSPIPHSLSPRRPRRKDKNDNCSTAIAREFPPVPVSPDCDACNAASPRACSWSTH